MDISEKLAQSIVMSMKDIIDQDLNYMNTSAIIIASTDIDRIGKYHEGANIVLRTKQDLVIKYDNQYEGVKKGINIPVTYQNKIVGVIGITGDKDKVQSYGKIIKQMTEILIKDAWHTELINQRRRNYRTIIENTVLRTGNINNAQMIADLSGFKMDKPHIAVIGKVEQFSTDWNNNNDILNMLDEILPDTNNNIYGVQNDRLIVFLSEIERNRINDILCEINRRLSEKKYQVLNYGVGTVAPTANDLHASLENANLAIKYNPANSSVNYYDDFDLDLIMSSLSQDLKKKYLDKVLGNLSCSKMNEYKHILEIHEKNNGSITKSAEQLYIHKNTLQYKLDKLYKDTGYNPRDLKDYVILKIAFQLT